MKKTLWSLIMAAFILQFNAQTVNIGALASGLLMPVGICNTGVAGDDRLFVLEKRGRIKIVNRITGVVTAKPFLDIYSKVYPVNGVNDERGLLGMAFHPDYASNGIFFLHYTSTNGRSIIARYNESTMPDTADPGSEKILLDIYQPFLNHNGGSLMFGHDGYLYISLGDGGSAGDPGNRAQHPDTLLGKMLRVNVNVPNAPWYAAVPGNPFYGATPGRDEVFDWGLRNAWRCSFDRLTGDMWIADVGQGKLEEINFRRRCDTVGRNYGWRCYEGTLPYNTSGCQPQQNYYPPVFTYSHSLGCSVTGGYVYRGAHEGSLYGKYLFTDYCEGRIWALTPDGNGGFSGSQLVQSTSQVNFNYSSFGEDTEGELYLSGISSGNIYTLRDNACEPVAAILSSDTVLLCDTELDLEAATGSGLTYTWSVAGTGWQIYSGQGTGKVKITAGSGNGKVYLTVSNGTCSAVSKTVEVATGISISGFNPPFMYCKFDAPFSVYGVPSGGNFTGPGMTGNIFAPFSVSYGTHTVSYVLTTNKTDCIYYGVPSCTLSAHQEIKLLVCETIGVDENDALLLEIHPNPSIDDFTIKSTGGLLPAFDYRLMDAMGKVVLEGRISGNIGNVVINTRELPVGLYHLVIQAGNKSTHRKVVITR